MQTKSLFILLVVPLIMSINTLSEGYRVPKSTSMRIYAQDGSVQGACLNVQNNHATNDFFVPTRSTSEWSTFITSSKPAFIVQSTCYPKTCNEIKNLMGSPATGLYTIDSDGNGANASYQAYCDMTTDGGGWTRIFRHNISAGYFANTADALTKNTGAPTGTMYSILNKIPDFITNGKYRFRLKWPGYTQKNIWLQTSNPLSDVNTSGVVPIAVNLYFSTTTPGWGGLELGNGAHGPANSNSSLLDGSVNTGSWWYAVGSTAVYYGGIPSDQTIGGASFGVPEVELWIKDDDTYTTYTSCKHILDSGASIGSGIYVIDPGNAGTPVNVLCDMTTDGGGWTRVMYHDMTGDVFFTSTAESLSTNTSLPLSAKYSILSRIASFYRSGKLELRIDWPGIAGRNWWTQTSNFTTSPAAGYVGIAIDCSTNFWAGLEYDGSTTTLADGSVGSGNWFYAVGAQITWGTPAGLPACDGLAGSGIGVPKMELWVK